MKQALGRPVYGLLGFRRARDGKVFAAVAPSRSGMLLGSEAIELPCTVQVFNSKEAAQEVWARAELAKTGKAFHGLYVSDLAGPKAAGAWQR